jgi:hypothetical protein
MRCAEGFRRHATNLNRGLREAQVRFRRCGSHAAVAKDHGPRRRPRLSAPDRRQGTPERRLHRPDLLLVVLRASCGPPVEGGKFAIIDGQHRTTSAAIVGYESVPCQIVIAAKEEQAAAFKAINGTTTPISIMALHAAALVASEPWAVQIAHVCACAQVELLRYPVPSDKQSPGQTMAIGAIAQCLKRYGEATLITALQCVTQTSNNQSGALSARGVLHDDHARRDSGLALFEAFDAIDLMALSDASVLDAAVKRVGRVQVMADRIREELGRILPRKTVTKKAAGQGIAGDDRNVVEFPIGHSAPTTAAGPLRKS